MYSTGLKQAKHLAPSCVKYEYACMLLAVPTLTYPTVCFFMGGGKSAQLALLSKIKLAYKRQKLYVTHTQRYALGLSNFLCKIQSWGLISFFEIKTIRSVRQSSKGLTRCVQCRLYLKYFDQRPAVSF